jgi:predicted ArsR family transcriptional regulator
MEQILEYLKKHGDKLDDEIAKGAGLTLSKTRLYLAELAAQGQVVTYHSTRLLEGQRIEGIRCRLSGVAPTPATGRQSKVKRIN